MQKISTVAQHFLYKSRSFDITTSFARHPIFGDQIWFKVFISLLLLNITAYFLFVSQHPIYNHEFRFPWIQARHGVHHGRWFNLVLRNITNSADIYAFVPLFAILMNVVAGFMSMKVWGLKQKPFETFIIIGLITTYPAFLSFYYFSWTTILFMSGTFFAVLALSICRRFKILDITLGGIVVMIMMASYQPSISVYTTVAVGSAIAALIARNDIPIVDMMRTLFARVIASAIGLGAYKISVIFMGIKKYTIATVTLEDVPERVLKVIEVSIRQLTVTQPELMTPLKTALLVLFIMAVIISLICVRKSLVKVGLVLGLWFGLVVATKSMYLLSPDTQFFLYRYNTSLAFFHAFTAAVIIYGSRLSSVRSLAILFTGFLLFRFVQVDLIRQEVLLRGQQHDLAFANRLLVRMESLPDIDFKKKYDLIRVGNFPDYRGTIFRSKGHRWEEKGDLHMDDARITSASADENVFILLGSKIQFQNTGSDGKFREKMLDARRNLLKDRKPWPHDSSIFVSNDKLIIYLQ